MFQDPEPVIRQVVSLLIRTKEVVLILVGKARKQQVVMLGELAIEQHPGISISGTPPPLFCEAAQRNRRFEVWFARYSSRMTNVQEARFTQPDYPKTTSVEWSWPAGSSRDEAVLWKEAWKLINEKLDQTEYAVEKGYLSRQDIGDRDSWTATFHVDLKANSAEIS